MKNDYRDDDSWENDAVEKGGDRFFDEWQKEDPDGFLSQYDITEGKIPEPTDPSRRENNHSSSKGTNPIAIAILLIFLVSGSLLFKGCDIGTIRMVDSNTYVTKTARVKMRHQYHLPFGDWMIVADSLGFRGKLNLDTGEYKFYYTCDEAKFEQYTNGTVSIQNDRNGYKFSGGPVEGNIIMTSDDWGEMNLTIKVRFEVKG